MENKKRKEKCFMLENKRILKSFVKGRRVLSLIIALGLSPCLSLSSIVPNVISVASAYSIASEDCFTFTTNFDTGITTIYGLSDKGKQLSSIVIPSEINGCTVKELPADLFNENSLIESVVIPSTITNIPDNFFKGCSNLSEVKVLSNSYFIGNNAFEGTALTEFNFSGCVSIGNDAFKDCTNFETILGVSTTMKVGNNVFSNTLYETNNEEILKNCILVEGNKAVNYFGTDEVLDIPTSITEFVPALFKESDITNITIPNEVISIPNECFMDCYKLTTINYNGQLEHIGTDAFGFTTAPESVLETEVNSDCSLLTFGYSWSTSNRKLITAGSIEPGVLETTINWDANADGQKLIIPITLGYGDTEYSRISSISINDNEIATFENTASKLIFDEDSLTNIITSNSDTYNFKITFIKSDDSTTLEKEYDIIINTVQSSFPSSSFSQTTINLCDISEPLKIYYIDGTYKHANSKLVDIYYKDHNQEKISIHKSLWEIDYSNNIITIDKLAFMDCMRGFSYSLVYVFETYNDEIYELAHVTNFNITLFRQSTYQLNLKDTYKIDNPEEMYVSITYPVPSSTVKFSLIRAIDNEIIITESYDIDEDSAYTEGDMELFSSCNDDGSGNAVKFVLNSNYLYDLEGGYYKLYFELETTGDTGPVLVEKTFELIQPLQPNVPIQKIDYDNFTNLPVLNFEYELAGRTVEAVLVNNKEVPIDTYNAHESYIALYESIEDYLVVGENIIGIRLNSSETFYNITINLTDTNNNPIPPSMNNSTYTIDKFSPSSPIFHYNWGTGIYVTKSISEIYLNGVLVSPEYYTFDSSLIEFSEDYIMTLDVGTYQLMVKFNNEYNHVDSNNAVLVIVDSTPTAPDNPSDDDDIDHIAPSLNITQAIFDLDNPVNLAIGFDFGVGDLKATTFSAITVNSEILSENFYSVSENVITILKDYLSTLVEGKYVIGVNFDDTLNSLYYVNLEICKTSNNTKPPVDDDNASNDGTTDIPNKPSTPEDDNENGTLEKPTIPEPDNDGTTNTPDNNNSSSNGNTSGSSGGYYPSTQITPNTTTIPLTNGEQKIDVTVKVEENKVTIEEIKTEDLDKVTDNTNTVTTIEVDLTTLGKKVDSVTFSNKSLQEILEKVADTTNNIETLSIKLGTATVEIDSKTLVAVMEQAGGRDIQLRVDNIEKSSLNNKQQSSLHNKSFHGAINAYFESGNSRIGDFKGGKVNMKVPFQVPEGYDANKFSVWYVAEDGSMTGYKTTYKDKALHFTADHFSDFVILYNEEVEDVTPEEPKEETKKPIELDTMFKTMRLKSNKSTKATNKLVWGRVKDADGYVVYGNKCNTKDKTYKMKKQVVIKDSKTTTWTDKELKAGTYYKYYVKAYKLVDGKKVFIAQSKTIRVTTTGGKYGNIKAVKVNDADVTLEVSKKFTIKATEVKQDKKIKSHAPIKFESSNTKVATVTAKGVIKAKKKGTATIYVYAQNGIYTKLKVTVK